MIRLDKAVTVTLPFHRYGLRLSHRLLTSLGGVSRFMLKALDDGLTLDMLASTTALSATALQRQLSFLTQHGFMEPSADETSLAVLSDRGRRMIELERLLQRDLQSIWLDAFTLKRHTVLVLAGVDKSELLADPLGCNASLGLVAPMPMRPRPYHQFDELGRLRNLLDQEAMAQLLTAFWPDEVTLIHEELDHWEYSLVRSEERELRHLPLLFPAGALHLSPWDKGSAAWPQVALPMLSLTTRFSCAKQLPWPVEVPPDDQRMVELVSLGEVALRHNPRSPEEQRAPDTLLQLPASTDLGAPDLPWMRLEHGVSATVEARQFRLHCSLDADAIPDRLSCEHPGQVLISRTRPPVEVAA